MNRSFWLATQRCARAASGPTAIAVIAAAIGALLLGERDGDGRLTAVGAIWWLQVPPFVAALACCLAAIDYWPTIARGRHGQDLVRRLVPTRLHGGGLVAGAALLVLAGWLVLLGLLAAPWLPVPHEHDELTATTARRMLDASTPRLAFPASATAAHELRLRPTALLPADDPQPAQLQVFADGQPLLAAPIAITRTNQLVVVPLPDRGWRELALERVGGNLPLLFEPGAIVAVAAAPSSRQLGAATAYLLYLLPAAVALAFALLLGPHAMLPVVFAIAAAALCLQLFAWSAPAAAGIVLAARGRYVPAEPVFWPCVPSLCTGLFAMIAAMLSPQRASR